MALPFNIILNPPNVIVSPVTSIYGVGISSKEGTYNFGYVRQTYSPYASVYAGQRILFEQTDRTPLLNINNQQYSLIDENKIFLIEPPTTPP